MISLAKEEQQQKIDKLAHVGYFCSISLHTPEYPLK